MGWGDGLSLFGGDTDILGNAASLASESGAGLGGASLQPYSEMMFNTPPDFTGGGGGGGFNFGGMLNDLGGMAKTAAPILGLGVTGLGAVSGIQGMMQGAEQQKMLRDAQRYQQRIAAPAAQAGASLTAAGEQAMLGGALPENLEAMANAREQELRAQIRSYFSHAGIQDSTMMAEYEGWIKQQTALYRAQLAQNMTTTGFQGIQAATGANTPIMTSSAGQMGQTEKNLAGANAAIAAITGASDDRKKKTEAMA